MKRRLLQQLAVLSGLIAFGLAVLAIASGGAQPSGVPGPGVPTQLHGHAMPPYSRGEVPDEPTTSAPPDRDYMQENLDGTWSSRLLPYAKPFPTREALEKALAEARRQGVIK